MDKGFQFIDGTRSDRATRRLIQSHAMKGKNAGRKLQRPSRLDPTSLSAGHPPTITWPVPLPQTTLRAPLVLWAPPFPLTAIALRVISEFFIHVADRLYPPHAGLSWADAKILWLRMLLSDEAAGHCTIAAMAACNDFFYRHAVHSPAGLSHLVRALALINKRLAGADALSDASLGLIVMLIIQEEIRQDHAAAAIHIGGLRRMVALRGGLSQLAPNQSLLLKVCKMEISYALQHGESLVLARDLADERPPLLRPDRTSITVASPLHDVPLTPELVGIANDVTRFSSLVAHGATGGAVLDSLTFQAIFVYIFACLDRLASQDAPTTEAACHAGLTLYMITVCLQFDRRRVVEYYRVAERLKAILSSSGVSEMDEHLVLWLSFVGGIWASGGDDDETSWYAAKIRALTDTLGLSWEATHIVVAAYPWLDMVHDEAGQTLWDMGHATVRLPSLD